MIGQVVGSYRVLAKLGEGGMGVVYLAEHPLIGKRAAIKVLLPEYSHNSDIVNRFFNEARSTTLIRHPGLVDIYDFGYAADGSAFIIMEFLEGESLAGVLRRQALLATPTIANIGRQIAAAVGAAHQKGIVHRDLKPDNVFLIPDAEVAGGQRVKILDFGIAKLAGVTGSMSKTRTGSVLGTPSYMSPEQCKGSASVDHRADIYSLGCILYEMACGRPPFVGEGAGEVLGAHIYQAVAQPRAIDPRVDPALEGVIMRSLEKAPDHRQASMDVLAAELERLGGGRAPTIPPLATVMASEGQGVLRTPTAPPSAPTTLSYAPAETQAPTVAPKKKKRTPLLIAGGIALTGVLVAVIAIATGGAGKKSADDEGDEEVATGEPTTPGKPKKKKSKPKFSVNESTSIELPEGEEAPPSDGVRPTKVAVAATETQEEAEEPAEPEPPPSGLFGSMNARFREFSTRLSRATDGEFHYQAGFVLIRVRSLPRGAEVFYDGASIGKTPLSLDFEKGTEPLTFRIALAGFAEQTQSAVPDGDQRVFAELVKIPVKIEVTITSTPPGADVHHDGQILGKTPVKLDLMSNDEPIRVVLKLERYKDKTLEISRKESGAFTAKLDSACGKKKKDEDDNRPKLIDPYDPCREK